MSDRISATEFEDRLVAHCSGGAIAALPRRRRDLAILLVSATLWLETGVVYSEQEINAGLQRWLDVVCPDLRLDHVTLRRELVDRNYLDRDQSGRHYTAGRGPVTLRFDDEVAAIDPVAVLERARADRVARKQAREGGAEL
jgi:hypothetical protein